MKASRYFALFLILFLLPIPTFAAETYKVPAVLMNFSVDDKDNWEQVADTKNNAFIQGGFEEEGVAGSAIQFTYDSSGWGCFSERKTLTMNDWTGYTGVSFYIKGTGGTQISFRFSEPGSGNDVWVYKFVIGKNNQWEQISIPFFNFTANSSTNGDGVMALNDIAKYGFQPVSGESGSFCVDEIMLTSPKEGIIISDFRANTAGSVYTQSPVSLNLDISNFYHEQKRVDLNYTVKNADEEVVLEGVKRDITVEENQHLSDVLELNMEQYGYYTVDVSIAGVAESERETEFSYIAPATPAAMNDSRHRLGFSCHFDHIKDLQTVEDEIALIAASGCNFIRQDIVWEIVEPERGQYDWTLFDKVVETCKKYGIELEFTVCYSSPYTYTAPEDAKDPEHYPPEFVDDFGNFVYQCVSRYKDYVKFWECWNEPNIVAFWKPAPSAEAYSQLLKAFYLSGKRADPTAVMGSGGMSGTGRDFFRQLISLGMKDYMDVMIIHPYQPTDPETGRNLENELRNVRNLAPEKDFWVSEWGWNITRQANLVEQAEWSAKGYIIKTAMGIDKIALYSFNILTDNGFGINSSAKGGVTRPVYSAIAALNRIIDGRSYVGNADTEDGVRVFGYTAANKLPMLAVWSDEQKTVKLPAAGEIIQYDLYGNPSVLTAENGYIEVVVGPRPSYLVGALSGALAGSKKLYETANNDGTDPLYMWQTKPDYYNSEDFVVTKGYVREFPVTVYNYSSKEQSGILKMEGLPEGWLSTEQGAYVSYRVPAYSSQVVNFTLTPPLETELGRYTCTVVDVSAKPKLEEKQYSISIVSEVGISLDKWQITFRNGTNGPISGSFQFDDANGWHFSAQTNSFTLEAGESVAIPYTMFPQNASAESGLVTVTGSVEIQGAIGTVPFAQERYVYVASSAGEIKIDGNLEDWQDVSAITFDTKEQSSGFGDDGDATKVWTLDNCSGTAKLKWDKSYLYMAVEVKDNIHYQEFADSSLWNADSLQIAFDTRGDGTGAYGNGIYELMVGKPEEDEAHLYKGNGFNEKGRSKGAKVAFCRNEDTKTSIYELRIPIAELDGMAAKLDGSEIGFSMIINDNDGQGRVGYMEWSSGIGSTKDARLFGSLWLKESYGRVS